MHVSVSADVLFLPARRSVSCTQGRVEGLTTRVANFLKGCASLRPSTFSQLQRTRGLGIRRQTPVTFEMPGCLGEGAGRGGQDIGPMLDQAAAHAFSDSDDEDGIYNDYMCRAFMLHSLSLPVCCGVVLTVLLLEVQDGQEACKPWCCDVLKAAPV